MNPILSFFSWYVALSVVGIATLPITHRLFHNLPSRGFTLARPLGLLVWGFSFWVLTSLGILQNDLGGVLTALGVLVFLSIWALRDGKVKEISGWLKENSRTVIVIEVLFFLCFLGWTWIRGMNPEAAYTEKPMELAFINSILRSPSFPPQDPWLSGYAISYYYFGYVMIAMITRVTAVASSVAFNLSSSLWFALTAAAAYGIVFDLLFVWQNKSPQKKIARTGAILGPIFILVGSTLEGVLEVLHSAGVFWKTNQDGTLTSKFWTWLNITDLDIPPMRPFDWIPSRESGWLWWRGSRVIQDLNLSNEKIEVIGEFPFFSYLLSDLHPHLLAMPFVILAIGLSLNLFIGQKEKSVELPDTKHWIQTLSFWMTSLILGSLAFINTWDFPIYVGLFCFTWVYLRYLQYGWKKQLIWEFLKNGFLIGITGVLLFLPFYVGFDSQAGGILPSLEFMTRGIHFWLLFGVLLFPIVVWLVVTIIEIRHQSNISIGFKITGFVLLGLLVLSFLFGAVLFSFQLIGPALENSSSFVIARLGKMITMGGNAFSGVHGYSATGEVLRAALLRRISAPGTWISLAVILCIVSAILFGRKHLKAIMPEEKDSPVDLDIRLFVVILVLIGLVLTIFPEFFYLRDQFGTRMNTIFKFYFQAWILWGLAAAFASAVLLSELRKRKGIAFQVSWIIVLVAGLIYPTVMLWDKTSGFSLEGWTLDGNRYIQQFEPDDYDAILWLQEAPLGIIAEAVGGSYSDYARISTRSGMVTVLGWPGHESQWRGGGEEMGSRMGDIQTLYETANWEEARSILLRYNIRYIYIGNLERMTYQVNISKFDSMLSLVYQNPGVQIFEVPASYLTSQR